MSKYLASVIPNNGSRVNLIELKTDEMNTMMDKYLEGSAFYYKTREGTQVFTSSRHCTIELAPNKKEYVPLEDGGFYYVSEEDEPTQEDEDLLMGVGWEEVHLEDIKIGDTIKFGYDSATKWLVEKYIPLEDAPHVWELKLVDKFSGYIYKVKLSKTTKVVLAG